MTEIKRFNGKEEFDKLLKMFAIVPTNTEIVDKTGVSKGSISQIMLGKRPPSKSFIDKFKNGFDIKNNDLGLENQVVLDETQVTLQINDLKDKMIVILETALKRCQAENERLLKRLEKYEN